MGNNNTARGVRGLLAAFAATSTLSATAAYAPSSAPEPMQNDLQQAQLTLIIPGTPGGQPQRTTPTPDDLRELDGLHKTAIANIGKRNAERCMPALDTRVEGSMGNAQLDKVLSLEEMAKARPAMGTPSKVMLVAADKAGYAVCFDRRLARSEHVATLYLNDKVIALNPVAQNADRPAFAQQQALATSLQYLYRFWTQGISEQAAQMPIAISLHPGSYSSNYYITQWGVQNLTPAPVKDFTMPKDPNEEKRRWQREAKLSSAQAPA